MFELFLLSGVVGERFGDALGAMHVVTFTLLATCVFLGRLSFPPLTLSKYFVGIVLTALVMLIGIRAALSQTLRFVEDKQEIIAHMQLLEEPVESVVFRKASPNPTPRLPGESTLDRIRRRGVIRVGYNEDELPFAYFNARDELVGMDINMAHALARDLGVRIEFVRFDRVTLAEQLSQDAFDVGHVGSNRHLRACANDAAHHVVYGCDTRACGPRLSCPKFQIPADDAANQSPTHRIRGP